MRVSNTSSSSYRSASSLPPLPLSFSLSVSTGLDVDHLYQPCSSVTAHMRKDQPFPQQKHKLAKAAAPRLLPISQLRPSIPVVVDAALLPASTRTFGTYELAAQPLHAPAPSSSAIPAAARATTQPPKKRKLDLPFAVAAAVVATPKTKSNTKKSLSAATHKSRAAASKNKKQKLLTTKEKQSEKVWLPVGTRINLGTSKIQNTYSFPTSAMPLEDWKVHQAALTHIPENLHLKKKGRDKSWMRKKRAILSFGCIDGRYVVPPAYGLQRFGLPAVDNRSCGVPAPTLIWKGSALWSTPDKHCNQQLVVDKVLTHFATYKTGGLIEVPTGSGKTEMAIYLACKLQVRTLFLVNSEELKLQTIARVKQLCPGAKVGIIQGQAKCEIDGNDFIVGMIKTLAMCDKYTNETLQPFGFVVIDEVEQICAKQLSVCLRKVAHIRLGLGMTATCDRKDGMIVMLETWIGQLIYAAPVATPVTRLISVQVLDFCMGAQQQHFMESDPSAPDPDKTTKALVEDPVRNAFILERIRLRVKEGHRMLVVGQYVYQAYWLWRMCRKLLPEINCVWYRRGMKKASGLREFVLDQPHSVIFSNVQLCQRGWNAPSLSCILMCLSKPDVRQLIGRLRAFTRHKRNPLLVEDIADQFFYYIKQAGERVKAYKDRENIILPTVVVDSTTHDPIIPSAEILADPCVPIPKEVMAGFKPGNLEEESKLAPMPAMELLPIASDGTVIQEVHTIDNILKFMQNCRDNDTTIRYDRRITKETLLYLGEGGGEDEVSARGAKGAQDDPFRKDEIELPF